MPKNEIKNTFTGGRMNKDLDERLITTGEYRDAVNVQVTTSEGSDIGSLHNIMGNYNINNITGTGGFAFNSKATCIGSIADEKNDKLYWLIEGLETNAASYSSVFFEYYKADAIAEYDKSTNSVNPVVVDVYEANVRDATNYAPDGNVTWTGGQSNQIVIAAASSHFLGGVLKRRFWGGMICTITDASNAVLDTVKVLSVNYATGAITFVRDVVNPVTTKANSFNFNFQSPQRALNFTYELVNLLQKHHLVTGINIIDKQLFWTDNNSEPKRIHIDRYRDFGTLSFDQHSWTPERDFAASSLIYMNKFPLVESHITVIRQKPLAAPQLIMDNTVAEGITEGNIINDVNSSFVDINSVSSYEEGDTSWIDFVVPSPDFQVGNILILTSTDANNITKKMRVKVIAIDTNAPTASGVAFKVEILNADPSIGLTDIDWHAELEQDPRYLNLNFQDLP